MTDKVVGLDGNPVQDTDKLEPIPKIVDALEELLKIAKSGDLRTLVAIGDLDDGNFMKSLVGHISENTAYRVWDLSIECRDIVHVQMYGGYYQDDE